jgi:hypothetical protein
MKTYVGADIESHVFLTSVLVGGEWSASGLGRFIPGERAPDTHWIGGLVGHRSGLDDVEKILEPTGNHSPTSRSCIIITEFHIVNFVVIN